MTGRGDFIEKYAETIHDLVDAGWGVASFDWRGQGLSGRVGRCAGRGPLPDGGFDPWLADLDAMVGWFHAVLPRPWFAMAHSMGGHLLLRHLAGENGGFDRVVLLSPMLGMWRRRSGRGWRGSGARHGDDRSRRRLCPRRRPRIRREAGSERQLLLTSDPERYGDEGWWIGTQNPACRSAARPRAGSMRHSGRWACCSAGLGGGPARRRCWCLMPERMTRLVRQ